MQQWFKIDFKDVFFNGLTTAEVGCVIKYKCACQQFGVDTLDDKKLHAIFNARELKFVRSYFGLCSDFVSTSSQVCNDFVPTLSKVCFEKDNKNNNLDNPLYIEREKERKKNNIIEKDNLKVIQKEKFNKPTLDDVIAYCQERNNSVDAEKWFNYYQSNGWKVGKNSMKDWRAAVRTWERSASVPASRKTTTDDDFYKQLDAMFGE